MKEKVHHGRKQECDNCDKHTSPLKKVMLKSVAGKKQVKAFFLCSACRQDTAIKETMV